MKLVSDSCKCSSCLKKYYCKDYANIVTIQTLAKKFFADKNNKVVVVFQVEYCPNRKTRKKEEVKNDE